VLEADRDRGRHRLGRGKVLRRRARRPLEQPADPPRRGGIDFCAIAVGNLNVCSGRAAKYGCQAKSTLPSSLPMAINLSKLHLGNRPLLRRHGYQAMIRSFVALAMLVSTVTAAPSAQMTFYQLPSGAFPHDVAPAPDGSVWISGQAQGFAGRFDPKTGKLEKIPLGPGAAPHGVVIGPDGNPWFSEGGQNAIARVDAKTK